MSCIELRTLLLDAGNTRLKWRLLSAGQMAEQGACDYAELEQWLRSLDTHNIARVLGCNVAGPHVAAQIAAGLPVPPQWIKASVGLAGVRNGYRQAEQLGADRWAALIAAHGLVTSDVVVVMAGTALTVDALTAEGKFLGGVIVPGFRLMRQALAQGTADLGLPDGEPVNFPQSTGEAIVNGALVAMTGAIETMRLRLEAASSKAAQVLLSGGDAPLLLPILRANLAERVIPVDNLVLGGLMRLANLSLPPGQETSV